MNTIYLKALTCRVALATLTVMILSLPATAGDVSVYDQFQAPTFDATSLDVHGQDFLSYDDGGALGVNVGSNYSLYKQTPLDSLKIWNGLEIDAGKVNKDADFTYDVSDTLMGEYKMWFGDPKGVAAIAGGALHFGYSSETDMSLAFDLKVGAQFGRMYDAKTIAQAAAIFKSLEMEATNDQLLAVAEVIGQQDSYNTTYKDEGPEKFYAALAKEVGTDNVFRLANVLNSPLYKIGRRDVGWEAGATANIAGGDYGGDVAEMDMDAQQFFNMGMLLDMNMGVWVAQTFTFGVMAGGAQGASYQTVGEGNMAIDAQIGFNMDHSIKWNTQAWVDVGVLMPDGGDMMLGWHLGATSDYAIGAATFVGGYLNVCGGDNATDGMAGTKNTCIADDELHYNVGVNFTHYIW